LTLAIGSGSRLAEGAAIGVTHWVAELRMVVDIEERYLKRD
jgi:hypothetical protein